MNWESEFRRDLRTSRCVVFVGAGVSIAATADSRSGWQGLVDSGLAYASAANRIDVETLELCRLMLETPSSSDLLEVATQLVSALGGQSDPAFASWLNRDVGSVKAKNPRVLEAVLGLELPIITTNYDDLLERAGNRDHVTWMDPGRLQNVLVGRSNSIAHLHGYYADPRSVVLSKESYELLLSDRNLTDLRNALAAVNTIIYVGFGEGLSDPNFASLRRWVRESLPDQDFTHYRLARASEVAQLEKNHVGERITVIAYGDSYDDLAGFLEGLETTATMVNRASSVDVFQALEDQVRASAVMGAHTSRPRPSIHDLLIPPVLLPVSHDQYILATKERRAGERLSRCDLDAELQHECLLVVADASSGLTSTLRWMVAQHHLADIALAPIMIDYRRLGQGNRPLENEIRRQLRLAGFPLGDRTALPPLALGLDNITAHDSRLLARVVAELAGPLKGIRLVLGCVTSSEIELRPRLVDAGIDAQVRYIGRLHQSDVRMLANLADGSRAKDIATVAVQVARHQHLPTTPFTFAMIISALMRGESLLSATSQTALLDAYVTALMGWGSDDDDSRFGMDSANRSYVVEQIAELFVLRRRGSLPQEDVVAALSQTFEQLEWPDSPIDTVKDLERRRIVTIRGAEVAFTQSSYLHLFAAKRALRSADFRALLVKSPLYFAPILQHYSSLRRDDVELLRELDALLDLVAVPIEHKDGVFSKDTEKELVASVDHALLQIGTEAAALPPEDDDDLDPLDERPDVDIEPFPLEDLESASVVARMVRTLGLVSAVLRDTEIAPDPVIRRRVLRRLLLGWAHFVHVLERDEEFIGFTEEMLDDLADSLGVPERRRALVLQSLRDAISLGIAFGGIAGRLSTTKLAKSLQACMDEDGFEDDVGQFTMAAILAFDIQSAGWSEVFLRLEARHGDIRAIDRVMRRLALEALVRQSLPPQDEANLIDFLVRRAMAESHVTDATKTAHYEATVRRSITAAKVVSQPKPLPAGRTVLSSSMWEDDID